jgi:hypothetical protein
MPAVITNCFSPLVRLGKDVQDRLATGGSLNVVTPPWLYDDWNITTLFAHAILCYDKREWPGVSPKGNAIIFFLHNEKLARVVSFSSAKAFDESLAVLQSRFEVAQPQMHVINLYSTSSADGLRFISAILNCRHARQTEKAGQTSLTVACAGYIAVSFTYDEQISIPTRAAIAAARADRHNVCNIGWQLEHIPVRTPAPEPTFYLAYFLMFVTLVCMAICAISFATDFATILNLEM